MCLGGGGLHWYTHFLELTCVGGEAHLYQTFTWMCSNVGPQHDMPNQTSDFRLYTHSWGARRPYKGCMEGAWRVHIGRTEGAPAVYSRHMDGV